IGHPKEYPAPGLVRLGEDTTAPPRKVRSSRWLVTLDKARAPPPSFQLVTGFATPPRAFSLFSIGSIPTTGPPFALLVLAKSCRRLATSPASHWWSLRTPPSYDDVTFLQVR
ncbi:hypothetical protein H1C71_034596, partial [Ictidomys tridecemlineatus]